MFNTLLKSHIDIKLGLYLIAGFILFAIIGTLSHELGHFVSARLLGFHPSINYANTFCDGIFSPEESFLITLGGPLQTVITGSLGFFILIVCKENFRIARPLNFRQWLIIFITLFWLREAFNLFYGMIVYLLCGEFPSNNDEIRLAGQLGLHYLAIALPLALIALCILAYVTFKIIPLQQRLTFIVAGLIGGLLGFYLWLDVIGPMVMP